VPPNRPTAAVWNNDAVQGVGSAKKEAADNKKELPTTAGKLVTSTEEWLKNGITMAEVEKHNHEGSAWIVVKDRVYDCTPYLADHPGGASSIMISAGLEATDDFEAVHSKKAWDLLEKSHYMGPLRTGDTKTQAAAPAVVADQTFLKPREFQKMPLVEKIFVNHDTRIFRFALPRPDMKLGLPTGQHIFLRANVQGNVVMRPYSPMTDDNTLGHVDFIIKVYFKNQHPRFPEGGKMSQHLDSMKIGDTIEAKGPLGEFVYETRGKFSWKSKLRQCKQLSLIAGGTGISLPYQVASKVLSNPDDPTKVKLLFANQTPDDILAKDYIDELVKKHSDRFEVWYTVDRVPEACKGEWKYDVGFISDAMISKALFPASEDTVCLMCGPPIMYEKACIPNLLKVGYSRDNIFEG
jgi:nitrate reductase (NAD(P)H)